MKKLLLLLGFAQILLPQNVIAQNDAKAKGLLDSVTKNVNSLKTIKANFSLSLNSANGKIKQQKVGTFMLKGSKYKISLTGQEIICDGKTVWTYIKETNEVQISNYNPNEQTISPNKLITNFYDKEYKYKYTGVKKAANGKSYESVELVPNNTKKQFKNVVLLVDKTKNMISGGNITEANGNKYTYTISNFVSNSNIDDHNFSFDTKAHKGVEVIDLR